jgi:alpha-maltose-1-phosphate synthase
MNNLSIININLSTSGSYLGGAAIAAEFHSRQMAEHIPIELWRMWDYDEVYHLGKLKIVNFKSATKLSFIDAFLPKKIKSFFLNSNIVEQLQISLPRIIHLHNPLPSLAFEEIAVSASQNGIKVVASTHGFYEVMNPNYGLKIHEKWAWKQLVTKPVFRSLEFVDIFVSGYPLEKKMLIDLGVPEGKIYLAPNGVNPFFLFPSTSEELTCIANKFNLSLEHPILLFIGNHSANKGLDTIMKVASQLSSPCTIVVGGKLLTPEEPHRWKQQFPVAPSVNVIFTDYLTTIEQRALYQLASVLLFPSLADTLPLTIIEAMASNLPVIAYDVGGISYQLQDGCGILVESGDTNSFLNAIEQAISNPAMLNKIALKAKARQESIFSWEKAARTTIDVYKQFL